MLVVDSTHLHPSTRLALEMLAWLEERISPQTVLEIGCGNGILSLTSAHVWGARVLACDISENSVADTTKNIIEYQQNGLVRVVRSDGFKHPNIAAGAPYELIIGNLLAQWQVAMAKDIKKCLTPAGTVLLSGILAWQMEGIKEALSAINMQVIHEVNEREWHAIAGCHKSFTC